MLNFLMLVSACGFTACAGLGCLQENQENKFEYHQEEKIEFHQENKKLVSYNDESYSITLSADELNNYVWENLALLDYTSEGFSTSYIIYDTDNFSFGYNSSADYLNFTDGLTSRIRIFFGSPDVSVSQYKFYYVTIETVNVYHEFEYGFSWVLNSTIYTDVKQAIELDIQANNQSDDMPSVLLDFVEILVGGIQSLASGIAGGIVSMATALFLTTNNGQVTGLSVFGGLVAIFAGLALAIGITTKVYTWVTSLGN